MNLYDNTALYLKRLKEVKQKRNMKIEGGPELGGPKRNISQRWWGGGDGTAEHSARHTCEDIRVLLYSIDNLPILLCA